MCPCNHVSCRLNADLMDRWNGSVPPSTADPGRTKLLDWKQNSSCIYTPFCLPAQTDVTWIHIAWTWITSVLLCQPTVTQDTKVAVGHKVWCWMWLDFCTIIWAQHYWPKDFVNTNKSLETKVCLQPDTTVEPFKMTAFFSMLLH